MSPYLYEIIVVDDGSTDGSGELLETIDKIRLIRFGQNRGCGTARRIGTQAARGDTVVWTDVDMSYPNDTIPALVRELEGHDQVVGARTREAGTHRTIRRMAKWSVRRLASYLIETPIPDLNSGMRAFRRPVANQFLHQLPTGFSCVTTLTMTFLASGYSVHYLPIDYHQRAGVSKFHWYRDTRLFLLQVLRMMLTYNPLRVFVPVGLAFLGIGGVKLLVDVVTRDFAVAANTLVLLFVGMQTITLGLLADLMGRLTSRPLEVDPVNLQAPARELRAPVHEA